MSAPPNYEGIVSNINFASKGLPTEAMKTIKDEDDARELKLADIIQKAEANAALTEAKVCTTPSCNIKSFRKSLWPFGSSKRMGGRNKRRRTMRRRTMRRRTMRRRTMRHK